MLRGLRVELTNAGTYDSTATQLPSSSDERGPEVWDGLLDRLAISFARLPRDTTGLDLIDRRRIRSLSNPIWVFLESIG